MPPSLDLFNRETGELPCLGYPMCSIDPFRFPSRRVHVGVEDIDEPNAVDVDTHPAHALSRKEVTGSLEKVTWEAVEWVR